MPVGKAGRGGAGNFVWGSTTTGNSKEEEEEEKARRERLVSEKVERDVEAGLARPGAVLQKKREGAEEDDAMGKGW